MNNFLKHFSKQDYILILLNLANIILMLFCVNSSNELTKEKIIIVQIILVIAIIFCGSKNSNSKLL